MAISINPDRGKLLAVHLHHLFGTEGIHGRSDMPEDTIPFGVTRGSLEHILFLTLTVSIDYQRDAPAMWESSRKTFEDDDTAYLFEPRSLHATQPKKIISDMQKHGLSKKLSKDAHIWRTVGVSFYKKWSGDPRNFLADCGWDCPSILNRLRSDDHLYNGRAVSDYPFLRGQKIAPLWLRMLRDNAGISNLENLHKVPIPVDIHVARATLSVGVVSGQFNGKIADLFESVREAWFESVKGLQTKGRAMIALDVDEPLWHLSKYGCSRRNKADGTCPAKGKCEVSEFCINGRIKIEKELVELDT